MSESYLSEKQIDILLQRIHPKRVLVRDGNSYVEGHDIKAELTRVFGFARWSSEVIDQTLIFEEQTVTKSTNKPAWYVAYRSVVKLTVCAPDGTPLATYTEGHVGDSTHPQRGEAHGNAVTNSETYALKRCAIALGDQFGLSLYNKGSKERIVRWTLVKPGEEQADTEDVPEVHPESEQATPEPDPRVTNAPQPPTPPAAEKTAAGDPPPAAVDPGEKLDQIAASIRQRALEPAPEDWGQSAQRWISHLLIEASKNKVQNRPVQALTSTGTVPLRLFLDQRLKAVDAEARAASANQVAS